MRLCRIAPRRQLTALGVLVAATIVATLGGQLRAQGVEATGLPVEMTIKPAYVSPSVPVTIAGMLSGYTGGGTVSISITPPESPAISLMTTAGSDGKFTTSFKETVKIGKYRVRAIAPDKKGFAIDSFTVATATAMAAGQTKTLTRTLTLAVTALAVTREAALATTPSPPQQQLLLELDQAEKVFAEATAAMEEYNQALQPLVDVAEKHPEVRPVVQPILDELMPMTAELEKRLPEIEKLVDGSKKLTQFCDDMVVLEETFIALTWAFGVTNKLSSTLLNWAIAKGSPAAVSAASDGALPAGVETALSSALKVTIKVLKNGKSMNWHSAALGMLKDVMQFATGEVFDVYCERFQGPVSARLLVQLNHEGKPYLKYDMDLKGKVVVNYAKDPKATRIPVKGHIEGNVTRFGLSENVALLIDMVEPKYRRLPTTKLRFMPPAAPYVEGLGMVARMGLPGYFNIPVTGELLGDKLTLRIEQAAIDLSPSVNKGRIVMIWLMSLPPFVHVEVATVPLSTARFAIARGIVDPAPVFPITVDMAGNRSVIQRQFTRDHNDPGADIRVQFDVRVRACNPTCE